MSRILLFLAVLAAGVNMSYAQESGFYVDNGKLYESNGNEFIMRGVNFPHAWFTHQTNTSIPAIAATGANTVRVVMATGDQWGRTNAATVENIINLCKANNLIAVLEVHDCTGYGDEGNHSPNAVHISNATQYWIDIKDVLIGQEDYVIINIANEPFGNGVSADVWENDWITAIQTLRDEGFKHTFMVDAANWGQDWQHITRDRAPNVMAGDPDGNLIFAIHMYEVFSNAATARAYMDAFVNHNLPLVVGEFAANHFQHSIPAAEIMRHAHERGFGYLGWSWSGNTATNDPSTDLSPLDIVVNNGGSFDNNTLTPWGEILINNPDYGITATSRTATIFTGGSSSSVTSSSSSSSSSSTPAVTNLIENGDFSNGTLYWELYTHAEDGATGNASFSVNNEELLVDIVDGSDANWHIQVLQPGISLEAGTTYTLSFDMYADAPKNNIYVGVGQNHGDYDKFLDFSIETIGTAKTTYSQDFTVSENETNARIEFCIGESNTNVFIDNVVLVPQGSTSIKKELNEISETGIESIHPNPFNPVANIVLNIAQNERATLEIVNISGRVVETYNINGTGRYTYGFDGSRQSSGVYFAVLRTNNKTYRQKMILIK